MTGKLANTAMEPTNGALRFRHGRRGSRAVCGSSHGR